MAATRRRSTARGNRQTRPAAKAGTPAPAPPASPAAPGEAGLIDMTEAIAMLKTTRPTFYRWLREGRIKAMKAGRQWRFYRADIERFLRGQEPRVELAADISPLLNDLEQRLQRVGAPVPPAAPDDDAVAQATHRILALAVAMHATDLHMEAVHVAGGKAQGRLRMRIDGQLHDQGTFDVRLLPALVERWKTLTACDPLQKQRPQEGRYIGTVVGREVDLRVTFLPTLFGEAIAARLLRPDGLIIVLDSRYDPHDVQRIKRALIQPWGLAVVTGPAGSGKTTTLYAMLMEINPAAHQVVTVEDPIEAAIPGVVQVQVRPAEGLTYAGALRTILRSDPDAVMVAEIRDRETMGLLLQAAVTGHLALSTMHADDAVAALLRQVDLGGDPSLVADTSRIIVGQRLVRRLCAECATEEAPTPEELRRAARTAFEGGLDWERLPRTFRKSRGCKACNFTGFRGRIPLTETLVMTDALAEALRRKASPAELRRIAVDAGMVTMAAAGTRLAAEGRTTLRELQRVLPSQAEPSHA